jgi:hypothetical protein
MNSNPTGYPALQQHGNPMLAGHAGYPVQSASPSNQQQMAFYPNTMPTYAQARIQLPAHLAAQQQAQQHAQQQQSQPQQQAFAAMQAGGASMMATTMAQHPSSMYSIILLKKISLFLSFFFPSA